MGERGRSPFLLHARTKEGGSGSSSSPPGEPNHAHIGEKEREGWRRVNGGRWRRRWTGDHPCTVVEQKSATIWPNSERAGPTIEQNSRAWVWGLIRSMRREQWWGSGPLDARLLLQIRPNHESSSLESRWVFSPPKLIRFSKLICSRMMLHAR